MDNTAINEVRLFVELCGGQEKAAKAIGVTAPAINHYLNGRRGITADIAIRMEKASGGKVRKERLVFGQAA